MGNVINQFIWGYQQHFRSSLDLFTKNLFDKLNPYLKPKVFLIGVLQEKSDDRHNICFGSTLLTFSLKKFTYLLI